MRGDYWNRLPFASGGGTDCLYAHHVTESPLTARGRGLAIASLVLTALGMVVALGVLLIFGGYALFSLTTGAPPHVLASIGHMGAIAAAFAVTPLSVLGLLLGVVSLVRSRRSRGRGMAITGVVLGVVGLVIVLLGVPFWGVEVCLSVSC